MSKICIVIPCFNEFERFNTEAFTKFLIKYAENYSILFVNDGSTDSTLQKLNQLQKLFDTNCFILDLKKNVGKAEAIRQGILLANKKSDFNYVAYFDADLATPLEELITMFELFQKHPALVMVLCSRMKRLGAKVQRRRKRHLFGRVFATFTSIILRLPVYDSQCGAKLIKKEMISVAFGEPFLTKWLFDVEIIARIRNKFPKEIETTLYEYPVSEWRDVAGSKLKLKHMLHVPIDLWRIHWKYNKKSH